MENLEKIRQYLIKETKKKVKDSVTDDILIIQVITHIDDLIKVANVMSKDLREWYGYYNPEFSREIKEHEEFVKLILEKKDKKTKESMGADLSKDELEPIMELAKKINETYKFKKKQEDYLEQIMKKSCPNISTVAGFLIGAKLIKIAGSLRRLAIMPSSTVQLLGAEEALFRHIKNKNSRCPKYGILHSHNLVMKAKKDEQGKAARILAGKISIAAKVDYMKGKFVGDKLLKEVEGKLR
jgi:nucleolar protein 56